MSPAFWIWSHLAFILLMASMFSLLLRRRSRLLSMLLCLLIPAVLGILPIKQTDVSGVALAHMGSLSLSTLLLLLFQLLTEWRFVKPLSSHVSRNMNLFWITLGLIVYPSALGLLRADTYSFGYGNAFSWCMLTISGLAMFGRHQILGLCLASAVLANLLKLNESPNLWDSLIDPWLWIAAVTALVSGTVGRGQERQNS